MKLKTKTKTKEEPSLVKKVLEKHGLVKDDDGDKENDSFDPGGWMIKGDQANKQAEERAQTLGKTNRIPALWVFDGERKKVRFRSSEPIGIFFYSIKGADGKWRNYTQPTEGDVDLFADQLQLRPRYKAVYEVFDVDGYVSRKDNKQYRNIPKFLELSGKANQQLSFLKEQLGGKLTGREITISRKGQGRDTTYFFVSGDKSPLPEKLKEVPRLFDKFAEYYAPISEKEQRIVVRSELRKKGVSLDEEE